MRTKTPFCFGDIEQKKYKTGTNVFFARLLKIFISRIFLHTDFSTTHVILKTFIETQKIFLTWNGLSVPLRAVKGYFYSYEEMFDRLPE